MGTIQTQALSKRYGSRVGIEHVDLSVPAGSVYGFVGPNGAGKTTTIRILLGFLRPTTGQARIFDRDCWTDAPRIKTDVGYVPGDLRLYPWLTARSALRILSGIRCQDLAPAGRELAGKFELDLDVPVRKMSRGMRQKLGLVLALAPRPKVLILDEPTTSLDPLMQELMNHMLRDLAADGHAVFFSSHALAEVENVCDRVAIVRDGRIVADESLDSLRRRASREVIIEWQTPPSSDQSPPPFLRLLASTDHTWTCAIDGAADALLEWLATRPVADLTIGRPDLERVFHSYYRAEDTP